MNWTRSTTIALASARCNVCLGLGLWAGNEPCRCTLRAVFSACYERFVLAQRHVGRAAMEQYSPGFSRKNEEYVADFSITCRRTLSVEDYILFKHYYLMGVARVQIAKRFGITVETLLRKHMRMTELLGQTFAEMEPYPLYPLEGYFSSATIQLPKDKSITAAAGRAQ